MDDVQIVNLSVAWDSIVPAPLKRANLALEHLQNGDQSVTKITCQVIKRLPVIWGEDSIVRRHQINL